MRLQRMIATVIITALLLSGCTSMTLGRSDILTPPKASGRRAEVRRLIETDAGGAFTLIEPPAGVCKNGMVLHDLDNDGNEEAVAIYTASDNAPRLLIATLRDNSYQLYGTGELSSSEVSELSFADIDRDGKEEILVCYDTGSSHSALEAFIAAEDIAKAKIAEGFNAYVTGDFDSDSVTDILLMIPAQDDKPAKASLMIFEQNSFRELSSCEIDSDILSYSSLRFRKISDDIVGAVADGKREKGDYTTQLIYYDKAAKMLVNPLYMNNNYSQTARESAVSCMDIDNDGIVNIPLCSLMDHTKDEDPEAVCSVARWNDYDPEHMSLSFKRDAVLCEKPGFMMLFDTDKLKTVTARYSADNAVTLYRVSYKNGEPVLGDELLTVYRYEKATHDSSHTAQAILRETTLYTYTYLLSEGSSITQADIENSFMLLAEEDNESS